AWAAVGLAVGAVDDYRIGQNRVLLPRGRLAPHEDVEVGARKPERRAASQREDRVPVQGRDGEHGHAQTPTWARRILLAHVDGTVKSTRELRDGPASDRHHDDQGKRESYQREQN